MTKAKRSRRQIGSIVAIVLCFCMLLGTTFAWFTDAVNSVENKITAGNLDVELYHMNPALAGKDPEEVKTGTALFVDEEGKEILWEPGVVAWENFIVKNEGTLALKYELAMLYEDKNVVVDAEGKSTGATLSQALQVAVVEGGVNVALGRKEMLASIEDAKWKKMTDFIESDRALLAEKEDTFGVVIYWEPSEEDNDWNVNNGKTTSGTNNPSDPLQIDFAIHLNATQYTEESDSFDNQYDKDAAYENTYIVGEPELEDNSAVVTLTSDIVLDQDDTIISESKTINLNGHDIVASRYLASGKTSAEISALTFEANATLEGSGSVINVNEEWDKSSYTNCGAYAVTIMNGAHVTIKDGTYKSDADAIYVHTGSLSIEGGFFEVVDDANGYADSHENGCDNGADGCHASTVINVRKDCWNAIASVNEAKQIVTISGGTFVNFNPANVREDANWGIMHHTNYVADGYKVESQEQSNGDIWYTVVPE